MKKFIFIIFIIIYFCLNCSCNKNPINHTDEFSSIYFPLNEGNVWYYDYPEPQTNPWSMKLIKNSVIKNHKTYYLWVYGEGVDIVDLIRADDKGNILVYKDYKEYLWFDFSQDSSASYIYNYPKKFGDKYYYYEVFVRTNITRETPAGVFSNCIEFLFDIGQVKDEEKIYTFAPNVGLIRLQNNGWSTKKLTSALIDGKTTGK